MLESKRGVAGGKNNIQVIYNGRIVTPQSLVPRKAVTGQTPIQNTIGGPNSTANLVSLSARNLSARIMKIEEHNLHSNENSAANNNLANESKVIRR